MAGSKFSLEAILSLTDKMTGPYKKTTNKITGMNGTLSRSFTKMNDGINRGLKTMGTIGLGALGAGIGLATREFINLDDSITAAGAKFKDIDKSDIESFNRSLKELSASARAVGKDTEFSAVDAAGALDKFAMAGMSSVQSMALLRGTTDLATAAGTDLTTAVDIATDSLGAFNMVTDDTVQLEKNLTRVSDVMAKTTTTANTSLTEMFEAVKSGGPAFTAAGQQIEDFAALTGVLANSGVKGSEAGTSLRNVMLRLSKPTGEALDVIEALGIKTQDSEGNFLNIIDIIGQFEKSLEGMGSAQRTAALTTVFGARSVTGMNILLAEGAESLSKYKDGLENSTGASNEMATAMRQSLGNRLKVIKSGLTELGLQFVETFEVDGRNGLDALAEGIQNFDMKPIIDGSQKVFEIIKKWGPKLLDIAPTIGIIAGGIKAWSIAQGMLNTALLASPIGALLIAATSLIAILEWADRNVKTEETMEERKSVYSATAKHEAAQLRQQEERDSDPRRQRLAARQTQEAEKERNLVMEDQATRHDIYLNAPSGYTLNTDGVAPSTAVNLGAQ